MVANNNNNAGGGNIFFTMENLAFSLPLLLVCSGYAYFKYVPLNIGLPILGGFFVLYQIRSQFIAHRAKKIQNMDDKAISDLALQLENDLTSDDPPVDDKKEKELLKKKRAVEQRLAAEKKAASKGTKSKKGKKGGDDDDEDDDALLTFAKGSRTGGKKKN